MSGQTHGGKGDRPRIIEDRTQYDNNWDRIFGSKKEAEVIPDPFADLETWDGIEDRLGMDISAWEDAAPVGPPSEYELSIARKMKEWELMYECLKSMHLYEYPVEEAKEVLKRIEDEK